MFTLNRLDKPVFQAHLMRAYVFKKNQIKKKT